MHATSLFRNCCRGVLAAAGLLVAVVAGAQANFPNRPVTIVVPYPAGGTTDVLARSLQEPMRQILGQPVVVENRPGASAMLATRYVASAPADGYTLLMPNNALAISPHLFKDAAYDPLKDFSAVSLLSLQPMVLVTNPELPVKTLKELIDYAKANPKKLEYASAGSASFGHLATELLSQRAGIDMVHIPYKGQAPTTQAILAGETKVLMTTTSSQMNAFIQEGRVRLLGVSSTEATPLAPGAQPISDVVPGFSAEVWFALFVPAGTPADAIAKLNNAVRKSLETPEIAERFRSAGAKAIGSTPAEMDARVRDEHAMWAKVVREANIEVK